MACEICQTRRPRRFCPGVRGDICTICCGTEREVSVDCPLDCEYLQEARKRAKAPALDAEQVPNPDIRVSENFLRENEHLLAFLARTLTQVASQTPGAVDCDVREALDALIRTYRTLQSGVYYESRPTNPLAARIFGVVQESLAEFRQEEPRRLGITKTRDADVLGLLVFLQRFELGRNNGRRRSRAFLDFLRGFYAPGPDSAGPPASSMILT
jgi:hypothetical protein